MIVIQLCSFNGHEPVEWDPDKPGELERMRNWFNEKLSAGFRAFAIKDGKIGQLITKFDEAAEQIVMVADKIKMVPPGTGG